MITLTTFPISTNDLYYGRKILTKEARETKDAISWEAATQWKPKEPLKGQIRITAHFYFKKEGDLDNPVKSLLDSFKGILWVDDKQVHEIHLYKHKDPKYPRVEMIITEI